MSSDPFLFLLARAFVAIKIVVPLIFIGKGMYHKKTLIGLILYLLLDSEDLVGLLIYFWFHITA